MIDYAEILVRNYPNSSWTMHGNDYATLQWHSDSAQPTQQELDDAWPDIEQQISTEAETLASNRQAGLEKIAALGLTAEEISAIFGV